MDDLNDKITGGTWAASESNQVTSEVQNAIETAGIVLSGADLSQLTKGISTYVGSGSFYIDSGAADVYVLTNVTGMLGPPTLKEGMAIRFIAANTNTGASTVNPNGLGATPILRKEGGPVEAGDIVAGTIIEAFYDGIGSFISTIAINGKLKTYNDVAEMVADTLLLEGKHVVTFEDNRAEMWTTSLTGAVATGDVLLANGRWARRSSERAFMLDNPIPNANMQLQRTVASAVLPVTPTVKSVDEAYVFMNTGSEGTSSQSSDAPEGFTNSHRIGRDLASGSTNAIGHQSAMKTADCVHLAGKSVLFAVRLKGGTGFSGANVNTSVFTSTSDDQPAETMSGWPGVATPIALAQVITGAWTLYLFRATLASNARTVGYRFFYSPVGVAAADDNLYLTGVELYPIQIEATHQQRPLALEALYTRPAPPECGRLSNMGGSSPFSSMHFIAAFGNKLLIDGIEQIIPVGALSASGGIIANYTSMSIDRVLAQSMAADTDYYVYAYMLDGVMTLDASTTGWQDDLIYGVRHKIGDVGMTLVGFLHTDASIQTLGTARQQTIISQNNRIYYQIFTNVTGSTNSNAAVELDSGNRVEVCQWSDDLFIPHALVNASNSLANNGVNFGIGLNSATIIAGVVSSAQVRSVIGPSQNLYVHALNPGEDQYFFMAMLAFESEHAGAGTLTLNSGMMFADRTYA